MTALSPPADHPGRDPAPALPEQRAAAPAVARSRVSTGAVLRGVATVLAVAALVAAVRALLGHRADETADSARFSQLVSYEVWRMLLAVTVALWTALGAAVARRLRTLPGGLGTVPVLVALGAWLVVVVGLVAFLASGEGGPDNPLWAARPKVLGLTAFVLVVASPLIVGLWCTRAWLEDLHADLQAAQGPPVPVGTRVRELLEVRAVIDACLRAGAVGLAAVVVTTGALRNALIELGAETETTWPASWLLVYGGIFTIVFAAVFVPAHMRWDTVADEVVGHAVPLPDDDVPAEEWHGRRRSLRTVLGREQSFTARLGSGLAITAPLLTSALAGFVPQLAS